MRRSSDCGVRVAELHKVARIVSALEKSRWRKPISWLFNGVLMVAVFMGVSAFQARNLLDTDQEIAPQLAAITLDYEHFDLAALEPRPTVVYFFAPWCQYCALSSDNLNRLRRLRDEDSLRIIAVALDWENSDEVQQYAERHELNVPVLLGDAAIARDWKVHGFPTYYVLDDQGRVVSRDIGYSTQLGMLWRSWSP
jgi:thiol-disulfide isomerase/thioredoxin